MAVCLRFFLRNLSYVLAGKRVGYWLVASGQKGSTSALFAHHVKPSIEHIPSVLKPLLCSTGSVPHRGSPENCACCLATTGPRGKARHEILLHGLLHPHLPEDVLQGLVHPVFPSLSRTPHLGTTRALPLGLGCPQVCPFVGLA